MILGEGALGVEISYVFFGAPCQAQWKFSTFRPVGGTSDVDIVMIPPF